MNKLIPQSIVPPLPQPRTIGPRPELIITPRQHGEILFEPPIMELMAGMEPRSVAVIPGIETQEFRKLARQDLMDALVEHAHDIGISPPTHDLAARPWVITGHQVEFYHAGVWAKVIAADQLAQMSNAVAIDLLVDHDVVDHLGFDIPVMEEGQLARRHMSWDQQVPEVATEFISAPGSAECKNWIERINHESLVKSDAWLRFSTALQERRTDDYVTWLSGARFAFEASMEIHVLHARCSSVCGKSAWMGFVAMWIKQADMWCRSYNSALIRYRKEKGITNPIQPMPDLLASSEQLELPFWIYGHGKPRERMVITRGGTPALVLSDRQVDLSQVFRGDFHQSIVALKKVLAVEGLVIRPRALTLTMFVRLALCEVFIHGIGGALYDQITDQLMREFFGRIPSYGCVSAGWLLDLPDEKNRQQSLAALIWQRHHLEHNPDLILSKEQKQQTQVALLLNGRREKIHAIQESLREDRQVSRKCRTGAGARAAWFRQLHHENHQLVMHVLQVLKELDAQIENVRRQAMNSAVANWREYFFALHSLESLERLIQAIRGHRK